MNYFDKLLEHGLKFHGDIEYVYNEYKFKIPPYPNQIPGIYIFTSIENNEIKIQKVGKAEGKEGLKGRLERYNSKPSETAQTLFFDKVLCNQLFGKPLQVYTYEVYDKFTVNLLGFRNELSCVRKLEINVAEGAILAHHPMHLTSFI